MAVDTAAKRASATYFLRPYINSVFPDGTIGDGDRQAAAWCYSGILADNPAASSGPIAGSLGLMGVGI